MFAKALNQVGCDAMLMCEKLTSLQTLLTSPLNTASHLQQLPPGFCRVITTTEKLDANSHKALEIVRTACNQDKNHVVVWGSLPCAGVSAWNHIHARTPEGRAKIDAHAKMKVVSLDSFLRVAKIVSRS